MTTNASLTALDCESCGYIGEPTLHRTPPSLDHWGAYCGRCKRFIKWVPHNTIWTAAFEAQEAPPKAEGPVDSLTGVACTCNKPPFLYHEQTCAVTTAYEAGVRTHQDWIDAIAQMGQFCWEQAESMGWHTTPRSTLERAMLVVTELAELSEAARHNQLTSPSEHIPEFTAAEEEWADVLVRVFDHSPDDGVTPERLGRAFVAKLAYNRTRGYKHGGKTI